MAKQPKRLRVGSPLIARNEMRAEIERLTKVAEVGSEKEAKKAADQIRRLKAKAKKDSSQMFEVTRIARVELLSEVVARFFDAETGMRLRSWLLAQTHLAQSLPDGSIELYSAIYSALAAHRPTTTLPPLNDRKAFNQLVRMVASLSPDEKAAMLEGIATGPLLSKDTLSPQDRAALMKRLAEAS